MLHGCGYPTAIEVEYTPQDEESSAVPQYFQCVPCLSSPQICIENQTPARFGVLKANTSAQPYTYSLPHLLT